MNRNKFELIFNFLLLPLDAAMIFLAFWLAFLVRFTGWVPFTSVMSQTEYLRWLIVIIPVWLVLFSLNRLYSFKKQPFLDELVAIVMAVSAGIAVLFGIFFFSRVFFFSRLIVLFAWILAIVLVTSGRLLARIILKIMYYRGHGQRLVLIIGTTRIARKIIREFSDKYLGYRVVGIISTNLTPDKHFVHIPVLGKLKELDRIVKEYRIKEIILADPDLSEKKTNRILEYCHDCRLIFKYSPSIFELGTRNIDIEIWQSLPILELKRTPLDGWGRIVKRIIDIVGAILALIILSPFFIVIPIIIKIDSAGPIFFRQKRVGLDRNFIFLKFRSMKPGAEKEHLKYMRKYGIMFKLKNDPRVTRFGKWLRKSSLDELPQLFNVLIGDMSLVGPRPPMPEEVAKYNHWQKKRLGVKPGMTGLWQVSGRSNLSFSDWVKLDKYYIENWSLKLDFQILLRTMIMVVTKVGAY